MRSRFPRRPPDATVQVLARATLKRLQGRLAFAKRSYGALVVDEAQDFHEDWWLPLQLLLDDPDRSPLYVFFDDNQRIFAGRELPGSGRAASFSPDQLP